MQTQATNFHIFHTVFLPNTFNTYFIITLLCMTLNLTVMCILHDYAFYIYLSE